VEGAANEVYGLGHDLVVRVPRSPEAVADLRKEVVVIPAARAAGVRAPEVVSFTGDVMVQSRMPGADLAGSPRPPAVLRELGRQLRLLHRGTTRPPGVPEDHGGDPRPLVGGLARRGLIDAETATWLDGWLDRLARHLPAEPPRALVHGDIAPQNILAAADRLTGIVDWGDAAWADPATDFAKMPLGEVAIMLEGYGEPIEARVLWYHLGWALGRLADPVPRPGERHWTAPPYSRLFGLLRFFAAGPPEPWARLG
jgi:hygromycin-B 7''-O-kinase